MFNNIRRACFTVFGSLFVAVSAKKVHLIVGRAKFAPSATRVGDQVTNSPNSIVEHYAVYFNGIAYDFPNESGDGVGANFTTEVSFLKQYDTIIRKDINITREQEDRVYEQSIDGFINKWNRERPEYNLFDNNCQVFVRDLVREVFEVEILTQQEELLIFSNHIMKFTFFLGAILLTVGLVVAIMIRLYALTCLRDKERLN